jgi:hypothetical protein
MRFIRHPLEWSAPINRDYLRYHLLVDRVSVSLDVLNSMISRAREYPHDEEGGILVGHIDYDSWNPLGSFRKPLPSVQVLDFIPSGPRTTRSSVSLYSDLEFQEYEFDRLSELDSQVKHLGSWHSHHCNGVSQLSQGDLRTYFNIVESPHHAHDYYVAILLHRVPWNSLKSADDIFKYFKFYIIYRQNRQRCLELGRSCIEVTSSPSPYADFINPGYTLPSDFRRKELFARSWFRTLHAKEIIREDNVFLAQIVNNNPYLKEGTIKAIEGDQGMVLTRSFCLGSLDLEYRYPVSSIEEGIHIRVNRNRSHKPRSVTIIEVRGRPIETRHHIFSTVVECFRPQKTRYGRRQRSIQRASASDKVCVLEEN